MDMDPSQFSTDAPGSLHFDPDGYWSYHPYPLPPLFRWSDRLVAKLSAADRALARWDVRASAAPPGFGGLIARLEAAASCRLSGLETDVAEIFRYESEYRSDSAPPEDHAAAAALAEAWVDACRAGKGAVSLAEIETIHELLLPGPRDEGRPAGEFRRGQTWIGPEGFGPEAAEFVPPPPEVMQDALESLAGFMQDDGGLPALVRLALVHYQFEVIHPFYDANGRVGRLLSALLLCRWGLLPGPVLALSPYFERRAEAYPERLGRVSRENAVEDWLLFFLEGIVEQAVEAERVLAALESMRADYSGRVVPERAADRLEQVIALFLVRPLLNVNQVDDALTDANYKSASRYVDRLVELDVLEETTGQARHRVFRVGEWVRRLGEIPGGQVPEGSWIGRKARKGAKGSRRREK